MEKNKQEFYTYLQQYNREKALNFALGLLETGSVTIPQLYEEIITPSLNEISVCRQDEDERIWQEHVMTNIARTVVECCYPYVIKQKNPTSVENGKHTVVVLCLEEEYHDIGARMGADYFTLENYNVVFVGGNTPATNVIAVCKEVNAKVIAISVSNFYHLVALKNVVSSLKSMENAPMVVISGSALIRTGVTAKRFGADIVLHSYQQLQQLEVN